jgi:hypothetical protein
MKIIMALNTDDCSNLSQIDDYTRYLIEHRPGKSELYE